MIFSSRAPCHFATGSLCSHSAKSKAGQSLISPIVINHLFRKIFLTRGIYRRVIFSKSRKDAHYSFLQIYNQGSSTMTTLPIRLRRNRKSEGVRKLVQETRLHPNHLVAPLFVIEGKRRRVPIQSMPGVERLSIDLAIREAMELHQKGVQAVALFPIIDPSLKSVGAEEAWNPDGILARAVREMKKEMPSLCVMADVALDPFTTHGHDGLVSEKGEILNDSTIECLVQMALMQAEAGVGFVAPSDMMDGRVRCIREALDREGHSNVGILAYSAKYASALYGPFRDALNVRLHFGDKK